MKILNGESIIFLYQIQLLTFPYKYKKQLQKIEKEVGIE